MSVTERILARAAEGPATIVLPQADDPRTQQAAAMLQSRGIVEPLLLGALLDEQREAVRTTLGAAAAAAGRPVDALATDPLYVAAALVKLGIADGCVARLDRTSSEVVAAALAVIGRDPAQALVSSSTLVELGRPTPGGEATLLLADCALVARPTAEELAAIAGQSAEQFRRLTGDEPRVALLSFSTAGSAQHAEVERVQRATGLLRAARPELVASGELQLDSAIVPVVAEKKAPTCSLRGRANVLLFPSGDAGSIGVELLERLAGARAYGPILQGLAGAASLLSPDCAADEIVVAAAIAALQAKGGRGGV